MDDDDIPDVKTSITSFEDIQQSINTSNWSSLTVFLNYLLTDSNSDPNYLVKLRYKIALNKFRVLVILYFNGRIPSKKSRQSQ